MAIPTLEAVDALLAELQPAIDTGTAPTLAQEYYARLTRLRGAIVKYEQRALSVNTLLGNIVKEADTLGL